MKHLSQLISAATLTTFFATSAIAATTTSFESNERASHGSANTSDHSSTKPFPRNTWERGMILDHLNDSRLMTEQADQSPAVQSWERGQLLNLLRQETLGVGQLDPASTSPRVVIYADRSASKTGLPVDHGNTQYGREMMLRYLEQAG